MPIIVLSPEIVNKIAAGEVVERPASAAKELMENSLDAGACNIEVEAKAGGLELLRVSDDGSGMTGEEMGLALQRHATSKINSYEDLQAIQSFGFRGEALPSIASVSRFTIISRPVQSDSAWQMECRGGEIVSRRRQAAQPGTAITVEDLFASVPARRKFLKSQATESRKIAELFLSLALANPGAGFKLISESRVVYDFKAASQDDRVKEVLGGELYRTLLKIEYGQKPLRIYGYLSGPQNLWPKRREQYLFVNGRLVSDRLVSAAVYQGFGPALAGRHPSYALFLEISSAQVDVNVHPSKVQVRFSDESFVFRTVRAAVEKALFADQPRPEAAGDLNVQNTGYKAWSGPERPGQLQIQEALALFASGSPEQAGWKNLISARPVVAYWQLHQRYILAAIRDGLVMIDQHAAHERILYEELLAARDHKRAQQLLFPVTVELSAREIQVYQQYREVFGSLGFDVKQFSGQTLVMEGLPVSWEQSGDGTALVRGILADLTDTADVNLEPAQKLARSFACRAAVKAGQALTQEEMNRLVDRLFAASLPYLDPHGRPVVIKFTLEDLEHRFGRI
ncbi:DNA mismatch repair endonuclease MutL [candidate division TA06 bacterium]|uniref:DNA mismatch repair protein MutL n=1 Tax=candidate division TA06 bacterium TaxID=2250710 RepID=A0A933I8J8_UNCT6|nr:DNA mismatch repair endonuclease MutL [candidate division TA06 bacterium]